MGASLSDSDEIPFLFINEGAATLLGSALGGAIIRDAVTRREVQLLEHRCICCLFFLCSGFSSLFSVSLYGDFL
jgi:hypothetical protein